MTTKTATGRDSTNLVRRDFEKLLARFHSAPPSILFERTSDDSRYCSMEAEYAWQVYAALDPQVSATAPTSTAQMAGDGMPPPPESPTGAIYVSDAAAYGKECYEAGRRAALASQAASAHLHSGMAEGLEAAAQAMEAQAARWDKAAQKHLPHWSSATTGHAASDYKRRDMCLNHASIIRALLKQPTRDRQATLVIGGQRWSKEADMLDSWSKLGQHAEAPVTTTWAIYYDNLGEQPYGSRFLHPWQLFDSEDDARNRITEMPNAKHYRPVQVYIYVAPVGQQTAQDTTAPKGMRGPLTNAQRDEARCLYFNLGGKLRDEAFDSLVRQVSVCAYVNGRIDFGSETNGAASTVDAPEEAAKISGHARPT